MTQTKEHDKTTLEILEQEHHNYINEEITFEEWKEFNKIKWRPVSVCEQQIQDAVKQERQNIIDWAFNNLSIPDFNKLNKYLDNLNSQSSIEKQSFSKTCDVKDKEMKE